MFIYTFVHLYCLSKPKNEEIRRSQLEVKKSSSQSFGNKSIESHLESPPLHDLDLSTPRTPPPPDP